MSDGVRYSIAHASGSISVSTHYSQIFMSQNFELKARCANLAAAAAL